MCNRASGGAELEPFPLPHLFFPLTPLIIIIILSQYSFSHPALVADASHMTKMATFQLYFSLFFDGIADNIYVWIKKANNACQSMHQGTSNWFFPVMNLFQTG